MSFLTTYTLISSKLWNVSLYVLLAKAIYAPIMFLILIISFASSFVGFVFFLFFHIQLPTDQSINDGSVKKLFALVWVVKRRLWCFFVCCVLIFFGVIVLVEPKLVTIQYFKFTPRPSLCSLSICVFGLLQSCLKRRFEYQHSPFFQWSEYNVLPVGFVVRLVWFNVGEFLYLDLLIWIWLLQNNSAGTKTWGMQAQWFLKASLLSLNA